MRTISVICCITALLACSSDPIGRVQAPKDPDDDPSSSSMPTKSSDDEGSALVADDAGASLSDTTDDAGGDAADGAPPKKTDPPPSTMTPMTPSCQANDAQEIEGKDTPSKGAGCGTIASAKDEDFFLVDVPVAKTITLRLAAEADAVARLSTPNDNLVSVAAGGSASIGSTSGLALVRIRSRNGVAQKYRFVIE